MSLVKSPPGASLLVRAVIVAALALAAAVALALHRPPRPKEASASEADFSAFRALVHLQAVAREPRPVGSEAHKKAREYVVQALRDGGLEPSIQSAPASLAPRGYAVPGGVVFNIVAVLPGRERGAALLLASHYDSVAAGPGASDDGAAVAAMLETLRALRAGPALKNDVIFLFTDAEEVGLVGAHAFVEAHPLARRVGAALNFEARGSSGPVFMFETSPQNGWLIEELAAAVPLITASSFSGDLYRKMPNDTDFTVFLREGIPGMNFAYIGGLRNYHTAGDTIENLDKGSLQQQGDSMLSLARRLGEADLGGPHVKQTPDAVYFNVLGSLFIHYSSNASRAIAGLVAAVFIGALAFGARRKKLRLIGAAASYGVLLVLLLVTAIAVGLATFAAYKLDPRFAMSLGQRPYDDGLYMALFTAITLAIGASAIRIASRHVSPAELCAGSLGVWLSLALPSSFSMPGASYLFVWPLFFGSLSLWALLVTKTPEAPSSRALALVTAALIPPILVLVPTIHAIYTAMTVLMSAGVLLFVTLLVGLLAAPLSIALSRGVVATGRGLRDGA